MQVPEHTNQSVVLDVDPRKHCYRKPKQVLGPLAFESYWITVLNTNGGISAIGMWFLFILFYFFFKRATYLGEKNQLN